MIELVDKYTLVKGEIYYVKRKKKFLKMLNQYDCIRRMGLYGFYYPPLYRLNDFYRYVSKEEYRAKLKEKYDATCLNIILKRLVDESFRW